MKVYVAVAFLLFTCCCISVSPLLAGCVIEDDEEYAVLAAVLFPNEPDMPDRIMNDLEREAYRSMARPRMSGFASSSYRLRSETIRETEPPKSRDFMDRDYYEKNKQACTIDGARLRAHLPGDDCVRLAAAEETEKETPFPKGGGLEGRLFAGMTYLSRPGFNKDRTEAVVEAHHQAHPLMGVGYRVYLKKSPKTGQWVITAAQRTRIS